MAVRQLMLKFAIKPTAETCCLVPVHVLGGMIRIAGKVILVLYCVGNRVTGKLCLGDLGLRQIKWLTNLDTMDGFFAGGLTTRAHHKRAGLYRFE